MARMHDTHHYESMDGTIFGFTSGIMLAIIALTLAVVMAAAVLLATRPWNSSSSSNNNVPNIPAQQGGGGNSGNPGTGQ